ncbi:L-dopachrome tautomerase yellow-f2-like [Culicoides brevitarsis]|uniref:L-dopachrome tautomerase yellow-f2-like n=1 Tax=Culicoides brevitarsis TaxID=469753 RepID=UPI00307C2524
MNFTHTIQEVVNCKEKRVKKEERDLHSRDGEASTSGYGGNSFHFPTYLDSNGLLTEFYKWKEMNYEGFGTNDVIPYNSMPVGVDRFKNKLFITVPRRRPGIPSSLNYIEIDEFGPDRSPKLRPFPNIETNLLHSDHHADPNKIISVYRTRIDECNRLWFVDTGRLEYSPNQTQIQPLSIWIMNPETGARIHRFEFPAQIQNAGNGVPSITVDVDPRDCENAFAYIPDLRYYKLYVYSLKQNRMWKFEHEAFNMDQNAKDLTIDGFQLNFIDGIFSITLGPRQPNGERIVYFHPMLSFNEFQVSNRVLQDETKANGNTNQNDIFLIGNRGPNSQSAMHHFDLGTGVMFFTEVAKNAVSCVNSFFPFVPTNHAIVAQDNEKMIYPSDLKVDSQGFLWFFTNNMPRYIYSTLDSSKFNFRVWRARVRDIVRGTVCQTSL